MSFYSLNKFKIKKIGVFRALQLGDLLCLVPSLRAMKKAFPNARIILIGLPWAESFSRRFSRYIDGFIEFPGFCGLPERTPDPDKFDTFFNRCQKEKMDLALQMHGSGKIVNRIVSLLGAQKTAGFFTGDSFRPDKETFLKWPKENHEIIKLLSLLRFLGVPLDGPDLELPILRKEKSEFMKLISQYGLEEKDFICIHPGARLKTRIWDPKNFMELIKRLLADGNRIVLTGSEDEKEFVDENFTIRSDRFINLAGKTSLGCLALLLKNSRLVISNDTGVSHVASAMNARSIIIVTGSDPKRWLPLEKSLHAGIVHPVKCRPCSHEACPVKMPCSSGIKVSTVYSKINRVINNLAAS